MPEIKHLIEQAKQLAEVDTCTLWALISLGLILRQVWRDKKEFESQEGWRGIRNQQIASETAQTEVMRQLVSEVSSMKMLLAKKE